MDGYVKNTSASWVHCMKRKIRPNGKVELDDLYKQYGEKHGLAEGEEFINWLRDIKLRDRKVWKVVLFEEKEKENNIKEDVPEEEHKNTAVSVVKLPVSETAEQAYDVHNMTVKDVVGLSVRKGREIIPNFMDINLLRYALQEARQLQGKDSLCQIIRKRIDTMQRIN